jgi:hypothetical protein
MSVLNVSLGAMSSAGSTSGRPSARLLASQHGVISRVQAAACGMTPRMLQYRTRPDGPWQRLLPGVYLTATGVPTADQADMAALLFAGDNSVITGLSALRRYRFRGPAARFTDVLIPAERRRLSRDYVVLHRTRRIPVRVAVDRRIQFALPARAVADATLALNGSAAVRALVAAAVQQGVCTVAQLAHELAAGPMRGSGLLRAALVETGVGIRSLPEGDLRHLVARAGLPAPLFNARLYVAGRLLAVPDAWWPQAAVAVEVDSREWHLLPADWEQTMRRHARLTSAGVLVLHFSPRQIRTEPAEVAAAISAALSAGRPVPGVRTAAAVG